MEGLLVWDVLGRKFDEDCNHHLEEYVFRDAGFILQGISGLVFGTTQNSER